MNGANVFRLILTLIVLVWAGLELTPMQDTPLDQYMLQRVTAEVDTSGQQVQSKEENRQELADLIERAKQRVEEYQGGTYTVDNPNPYPSFSAAIRRIADDEGIDLAQFYADLAPRLTSKNTERRNDAIVREMINASQGALDLGLDLAGGVSLTYSVDPNELDQDNSTVRAEQMANVRNIIAERVDSLGVAEPVVRVKGDNLIEVQMPGLDTSSASNISKTAKLEFFLVHPTIRNYQPGMEIPLGYKVLPYEQEDPRTGELIEEPILVERIPVMKGDAVSAARPSLNESGSYLVQLQFTDAGQEQFANTTQRMAQEQRLMAIVLDNEIVSTVSARARIDSPSAVIERGAGGFPQAEAFDLSNSLSNPLSTELRQEQVYEIGASLAEDAKVASLRAGAIGGALVVVFMIAYYGIPGIVAMVTVCLNLLFVAAALAAFGATITLPGVAALVLTIGMAVDANILIFERIREELNVGKSVALAFQEGFSKSVSTILDANVTTLITALILFQLGEGPVKGFGVTLATGIVFTVFCSLVVSRWVLDLLVSTKIVQKPFRLQFFSNLNFQFLNYTKRAAMATAVVLAIGAVSLVMHRESMWGIDFTGGDQVSIGYQGDLTAGMIEDWAHEAGFEQANAFAINPVGAEVQQMAVQTAPDQGRALFDALDAAHPEVDLELVGLTQIAGSVGNTVIKGAIIAMTGSLLAMLLYIAIRFEFGYALGAVVASLHDILLTIGIYVFLGEFLGLGSGQFSAPMIAAILMTIGYSINDTIVVFDRIREELDLNPGLTLRQVVTISINRVLNRTVWTSVTTFFAAFMLFIFGAGVVQDFSLIFLLGVLTGTFSSMFVATPVFYAYHKGSRKHVEESNFVPNYAWQEDGARPEETTEEQPSKS
ncbi:MAG: protein translocase subunit SecD [Verrucomicrobiota bacterium JB022]|nr:protein translocase subunit SecD [Verrucomicrobiota bacterium JB022]